MLSNIARSAKILNFMYLIDWLCWKKLKYGDFSDVESTYYPEDLRLSAMVYPYFE